MGKADEEDIQADLQMAMEMVQEMRDLAWEHRLKIREYSCDGRLSEESGLSNFLDLLILTEVI